MSAPAVLTTIDQSAGLDLSPPEAFSQWQPDWPIAHKALALVNALQATSKAGERMVAVALLAECGPSVAPTLEVLADTPLNGHAQMVLASVGVEPDTAVFGIEPSLSPVADTLAAAAEHGPDSLLELWASLTSPDSLPPEDRGPGEHHRAQRNLIDGLWRVDLSAAAALDALGKHLPDKAMAKPPAKQPTSTAAASPVGDQRPEVRFSLTASFYV